MSAELMGAVWKLQLPHSKQLVLLALADHAHDDGTHCYPGIPRLAWKTGYTERNVTRILGELEADGILEAQDAKTGGYGNYTEYHIHLEKGDKKDEFQPKAKSKRVTSQTKRVTSETLKGDKSDKKGDKSARAYIEEPSYEPSYEPSEKDAREKTEGSLHYLNDQTRQCVDTLRGIDNWTLSERRTLEIVSEAQKTYPAVDVAATATSLAFKIRTGAYQSKQPSRAFVNWVAREGERSESQPAADGTKAYRSSANQQPSASVNSPEADAQRREGYEWLFK